MIDNTELSSRILACLEEAGSERANPLLNSVIDPAGNPDEVSSFQNALLSLVMDKQIVMRMTSIPNGEQPLSDDAAKVEIELLASNYRFDTARSVWTDERYSTPPYYQLPEPDVVLTRSGRAKSTKLLQERGYEWWRLKG